MSDHIKVLAEMFGISTDVMRIIIAAKEQEKFICDLYGVKSLSQLDELKKSDEQAAAINWLSAKTTPIRAAGRSISGAANRAEPTASASDTPEREQSTSPADELRREAMPQTAVTPEQADTVSQAPAAAALPVVTRHKLKTRTRELGAEIELAKTQATDSKDHHSVWAALVAIAKEGAPPFTKTVDETSGIHYTDANGNTKFFSKDALRKRMNPSAR